MLTRRISLSSLVFLAVFVLQESLFNQVRLPLGGFSLYLIFTLSWAALSTPELGAAIGFGAGALLDLSPTSDGPIGQWMLVLIIVGFAIAFLRYGDDSLRGNPLSLVFLVAAAMVVTLTIYLCVGAILGLELGTSFELAKTVLGNGLWTLAVAPFVLPIVSRLHRMIFDSKENL